MISKVPEFIQSRKTNSLIKQLLWYIIECHRIFINENKTHSQKWVKENTTLRFEDYLKFEFIDNYLNPNKHLLNSLTTNLKEINFTAETQKRYIDSDGKQKPDKIDISVSKIGLQKYWSNNEDVYFAIECKRITKISDTQDYIIDIEKFCNRNHTNFRLPFEGQIAFIENSNLKHFSIAEEINNRLKKSTTISTTSYLSNIKLHKTIDATYQSIHKKNFLHLAQFSIFHLMFDYSKVVKN